MSTTTYRPDAIAFDVVETLMALEPLGQRFAEVGLPAQAVREWFPRILLYGIGMDATGTYAPFPVCAAAALRTVSRNRLTEDQVQYVVSGMRELPAHPDIEPGMKILRDAGVRLSCLTNGAPEVTQSFLDRSGLTGYVEAVYTTSELQCWKPPAPVYLHAAGKLGLDPERVMLVACHAWDCNGAKRAGLMAGFIARAEGAYDDAFFAPAEVRGETLVEVAEQIVALPPRP
jgi:2-haloacid dehalogenase